MISYIFKGAEEFRTKPPHRQQEHVWCMLFIKIDHHNQQYGFIGVCNGVLLLVLGVQHAVISFTLNMQNLVLVGMLVVDNFVAFDLCTANEGSGMAGMHE